MTTTSTTHDHWTTLDELANGGDPYDPAEVVDLPEIGPAVPRRCSECGGPAYYDTADDNYHHAVDAATGCFLIPAEDRPDDPTHPLVGA